MASTDHAAVTPGATTHIERLFRMIPRPVKGTVVEIGQMLQLLGRVVYSAVRHPRGYWADTRDEAYELLRLCLLPAMTSVFAYLLLSGTAAIALLQLLGAPNQLAPLGLVITVREVGVFVTALVIAGVIGTSVTADLGARKIREELDALQVLGIDIVRLLVIPRILAMTGMMVLLGVAAFVVGSFAMFVNSTLIGDVSPGAYLANMLTNVTAVELWGALLKLFLVGLLIGTVFSHKGLTVAGGPEGVGRAVNQAVVIAFLGIWILNLAFNATIQGLYPELQTIR